MKPQPVLEDGLVRLRPYKKEDAPRLYEAVRSSIASLCETLPWCHEDYCMEESSAWIELCLESWDLGKEYEFAVFDATEQEFLGGCGINQINPLAQMANLGYWVKSSATKKGVASRAAKLLARFGIQELGLTRIEIITAVDNIPSQRVAEKCGAKREAVLRNRIILNGQVKDAVVYSIIPSDLNSGP